MEQVYPGLEICVVVIAKGTTRSQRLRAQDETNVEK